VCVWVCAGGLSSELEERARLLKQRLVKTSAGAALAAADGGSGGVPFSDSELSGHRSRPGRDAARKTTARSGVDDSASQRSAGSAGRWNATQDSRSAATAAAGATGRHAGRSSGHRHEYQRRSHTADVQSDRAYRRRGRRPTYSQRSSSLGRNRDLQSKRFRLFLHIYPSVLLFVWLSHSCTLLKPFNGCRCHLAGTVVGSVTLCHCVP